jgi:hypothetical protein
MATNPAVWEEVSFLLKTEAVCSSKTLAYDKNTTRNTNPKTTILTNISNKNTTSYVHHLHIASDSAILFNRTWVSILIPWAFKMAPAEEKTKNVRLLPCHKLRSNPYPTVRLIRDPFHTRFSLTYIRPLKP